MPASLLPHAAARNQTPSTSPTKPGGASFVMIERPIGDRNSSPTVCRKNSATSHNGLTLPSAVSRAAGTISKNESPRKAKPSTNLTGLEGCRGPSRSQAKTKIGASRTTKRAFSAWYQADGNDQPNRLLLVS